MSGHLILLCGTSFSGKTQLAHGLADKLSGTIISLDDINAERGLWGGDGIPVADWARTNEISRQRAQSALEQGATVIVDDTCSPRSLRDGWRALAADCNADMTLVHVDTPEETVRARHAANRTNPVRPHVTDAVLEDHLRDFQPPTDDEHPLRHGPDDPLEQLIAAIRRRCRVTESPA